MTSQSRPRPKGGSSEAERPSETRSAENSIGALHREEQLALRALEQIGGRSWWVILTALAIGLLIGFAADALLTLLRGAIQSSFRTSETQANVAILMFAGIALSGVLIYLRERADKFSGSVRPVIDTRSPAKAKVLVLFASTPNFPSKDWLEENPDPPLSAAAEKKTTGEDVEKEQAGEESVSVKLAQAKRFLDTFQTNKLDERACFLEAPLFTRCNWRPPCEALAYHGVERGAMLERVILIPSCDGLVSDQQTGSKGAGHAKCCEPQAGNERELAAKPEPRPDYRGSFRFAELMRSFFQEKLEKSGSKAKVEVLSEATLGVDAYKPHDKKIAVPLSGGIDFEDIDLMVAILHDLYKNLAKDGYKDRDIIVDVTGGQKTNGIAGAVFAVLVRDRRFQYASTNNVRNLRSYDVLYADE